MFPDKNANRSNSRVVRATASPSSARLTAPKIHFQVSDADDLLWRGDVPSAAKNGPHPSHQLPRGERFHEVVVRPQLEAENAIHLVVPGSQEQDGEIAFGPDATTDVESVELTGESDVEDDDPGLLLTDEVQALVAVPGEQHAIAVPTEVKIDEVGDVRIVFDHHHGAVLRVHGPSLALGEVKWAKFRPPLQNPHVCHTQT